MMILGGGWVLMSGVGVSYERGAPAGEGGEQEGHRRNLMVRGSRFPITRARLPYTGVLTALKGVATPF